MEKDIKKYLESQHWIKFITRDIPFIRNAIIFQSYLKDYKKDIGWYYTPGLSIFEMGIADIYKSEEGLSDNARNFLKVKNKKAFFERILKETKIRKKKVLENIEICENKIKNKKIGKRELLNLFKLLYLSFRSFWNFQYFPMGLEFSLNSIGKQDLVLKYKKYMVDIREQSQYITIQLEDLIDIVLKRIAESKKLPEGLIKYAVPEEIISDKIDGNILKERSKLCIQMGKGNRYFVFKNREAKEIKNFISSLEERNTSKEIKGNPAYAGKIQGSARVILYRKDLSEVKKGEILVTPMTEAFYAPYLKKVKGIVTNEGGITCHAAIISRELKIPCVIGTKIATKLLKNGDRVEVDANKGIVKIIKK